MFAKQSQQAVLEFCDFLHWLPKSVLFGSGRINKPHQLRHQCQKYFSFNNWNWCRSAFFHLCWFFLRLTNETLSGNSFSHLCRIQTTSVSPRMEAPRWEPHLFSNALPLGFSLPPEVPAPNNKQGNVARATGALPNQGYHEIIPVTSFNMFLIVFFLLSSWNLKYKNHSPICIRFEHGSTTSLPPGIEAVIWQTHLHALSTTSSSSFLMAFWSSWPAQAPCKPRDEMVRTGQISLEASPRHEQQVADVLPILWNMKIGFWRIYDTAPCFPSNLSRQCPRVFRRCSEICPVWKWSKKLHQLRHQCQKDLLFNKWSWCRSAFFHLCHISICFNHICNVKFHLKPIHVISNKLLTFGPFG